MVSPTCVFRAAGLPSFEDLDFIKEFQEHDKYLISKRYSNSRYLGENHNHASLSNHVFDTSTVQFFFNILTQHLMHTVRTSNAIILRYVVSSVCNSQNINSYIFSWFYMYGYFLSTLAERMRVRSGSGGHYLPLLVTIISLVCSSNLDHSSRSSSRTHMAPSLCLASVRLALARDVSSRSTACRRLCASRSLTCISGISGQAAGS